jgi:hypothetical protein
MAKQRSGRASCQLSNLPAGRRLDADKLPKCLVAMVLAASLIGNGCAGVVMGSNPSGNGSTKSSGAGGALPSGTPSPGGTPSPANSSHPQLSASPMSASFPMVTTGTSSSQTITLQNGGNASVTISAANVTGAGFGASGLTLPMSIAAGQRAAFNVVFAPNVPGNATGSISLISDARNSPLVISANGTGFAATALLSASTSALDFGSVLVGSSLSLGVTLTNAGNANVTISNVLATGTGFAVNGAGANTVLTPGQTAALNVTFAPSALGAATGSISVSSSAGALAISLSGNGGQLSSHTVALNWDPSTSTVIGYYVYRLQPDGTYGKINTAPLPQTLYTDANIQSGQTYTYVVTAVDSDNVESDYSDPVLAVIP